MKPSQWPHCFAVALYAKVGPDAREGAIDLWRMLGLRHCLGSTPFAYALGDLWAEACPLSDSQWRRFRACRDLGALPAGLVWKAVANGGRRSPTLARFLEEVPCGPAVSR
jgi:hypothetical protein